MIFLVISFSTHYTTLLSIYKPLYNTFVTKKIAMFPQKIRTVYLKNQHSYVCGRKTGNSVNGLVWNFNRLMHFYPRMFIRSICIPKFPRERRILKSNWKKCDSFYEKRHFGKHGLTFTWVVAVKRVTWAVLKAPTKN